MAPRSEMAHLGLNAVATLGIVGSTQDSQTALGNSQGTAFKLAAANTIFTTAAASTGAILRSDLVAGDEQQVYNLGANAVAVYPPVGGTINGGAANSPVNVAAGKSGTFLCRDNLNFVAQIGA